MLKPALQLKLGQQLTMTPQLQQAIKLLQLPVLELQAQVMEALETNVMLEQEEDDSIDLTPLDQVTPTGEAEIESTEGGEASEAEADDPGPDDVIEKLPLALQDLIARSMALQTKVRRLDTTIHAPAAERAPIGNPLVPQLNRLKAAFERQSG